MKSNELDLRASFNRKAILGSIKFPKEAMHQGIQESRNQRIKESMNQDMKESKNQGIKESRN